MGFRILNYLLQFIIQLIPSNSACEPPLQCLVGVTDLVSQVAYLVVQCDGQVKFELETRRYLVSGRRDRPPKNVLVWQLRPGCPVRASFPSP